MSNDDDSRAVGSGSRPVCSADGAEKRGFRRYLPQDWTTRWLLVALLAALGFGLYGRFAGLGKWPFGVDEYYSSRSIDNILRTGLPRFACGGFYVRGLTYQYAVAAVRLTGLHAELAGRLISAASGLLGLPAAYLLGRRLGDRPLGLALVILLLLSVWEIEMGRFARMYAPFQSVFLWYLVFFLRYAVDRERAALLPMLSLSVLGVLTWEGGALLGIANLLPPFLNHDRGRLQPRAWRYLAVTLPLLALLVAATRDLRDSPDTAVAASLAMASHPVGSAWWLDYSRHPAWMLALLVLPLPLIASSFRWLWTLRDRWLTLLGLTLICLGALLHQFVLCLFSLLLVLLMGLLQPTELRQRGARAFLLAVAICAAFWTAFGLSTGAWTDTTPHVGALSGRWLGLLEHLCGYPDVFGQFLRPWGRTLPAVTVGAVVFICVLIFQQLRRPAPMNCAKALVTLLLVLMLAVGSRTYGMVETRYTFFLYPLVMALSLSAVFGSLQALRIPRAAPALGAVVSLLLFALGGDFQPLHVARIDTWAVNFRVHLNPKLADHYYPRADFRMLAAWLTRNVRPGDLVLTEIPTVDEYYHRADAVFLPDGDERYDDYACPAGKTERWTGLPLLYGADSLSSPVRSGRRIFVLMYPDQVTALQRQIGRRGWQQQIAWTEPDGGAVAIVLNPY